MSILNTLLGNEQYDLQDKDIAYDILKNSKFDLHCLITTAQEAVNPELRQLLNKQLTDTLNLHYILSDLMINKGWYPAKDDPNQQLQKDIMESPIKFKKDN